MNGIRIANSRTLEERLSAVAVTLCHRFGRLQGRAPDYADFRDAFRSYVRLELVLATLDGLRTPSSQIDQKKREMLRQLADIHFEKIEP